MEHTVALYQKKTKKKRNEKADNKNCEILYNILITNHASHEALKIQKLVHDSYQMPRLFIDIKSHTRV